MESLPDMLRHVRQAAGAAPEDVVLRTQTAVEELLTNSVVHGHAEAHPGSEVWMSVTDHGGALYLCYEDALAPFDPAGKIGEALARTANPLDQRPLGGLGLLMVHSLLAVIRALGRTGWIETFKPAVTVRPLEVLRSAAPPQRRVRKRKDEVS